MTAARACAAFVLVGIAMVVVQTTLLREALEISRGDEVSIALGWSTWLIVTGMGAAAGRALPVRVVPVLALSAVPAAFAGLFLLRASRMIGGAAPGVLLSHAQELAAIVLALAPCCLINGAMFTCAASVAGRAVPLYIAEALGWLFGGVLAGWVSPFYPAFWSLVAGGVMLGASAAVFHPRSWTLAALAALLIGAVFHAPLGAAVERRTLPWKYPGQTVAAETWTPQGHGIVLERHGQVAFYVNGALTEVLPEIQTAEELTAIALLQRAHPKRVLVVGGFGGVLAETLKYDPDEVHVSVPNSRFADLLGRFADAKTKAALADPRVHLIFGDTRQHLRSMSGLDAVLLACGEPATLIENRLYTEEFFSLARRALAGDGVLAFALPGSELYYDRALLERNGSVFRALSRVFPEVMVTPLSPNYFLASGGPLCADPPQLGRRLEERRIAMGIVNADYLESILPADRMQDLAREYAGTARVNRDAAPIASLASWRHEVRRDGGSWRGPLLRVTSGLEACVVVLGPAAVAVVLALALAGRAGGPNAAGGLFAALAGFVGLGLNVMLVITAQQLAGTAYQIIGILAASSMGGLAVGGWICRRARIGTTWWAAALVIATLTCLGMIEAAAGWNSWATTFGFSLMAAVVGACLGGAFVSLIQVNVPVNLAYAADLAGAGLAGIVVPLVLFGVLGRTAAVLMLAVIGLLAWGLASVACRPRSCRGGE